MSDRYPHCSTCGKALGVHVGIRKGDLRFCNAECEASQYRSAITEGALEEAVLLGSLEALRQQNPRLSEKSLLALHYLGWDKIPPKGTEDYKIFRKVRKWAE